MKFADSGNGVTQDSLAYFHGHIGSLGPIVVADVLDSGDGWPCPYHLMLHDGAGNRMALSGCAGGTHGEPARGATQILVEAGFSAGQARRVLAEAPLRLTRSETPRSGAAAPEKPVAPLSLGSAVFRSEADRNRRADFSLAGCLDGNRVRSPIREARREVGA
jgi:hypothetical protein